MVLQSRKFGCVWKPGFVKSGHIYTLAAVLFIWFTQTILRKQEKQTCAFAKVQRKDPQLGETTVTVNGLH